MVKKTFLVLICFIGLIIFVSTLYGQGSKKTITLPSGEVVWDLNGKWEVFTENYGEWNQYGSYSTIVEITQKGSSFVAVRMTDNPWYKKGSVLMRGKLDKNGVKEAEAVFHFGDFNMKGQILDNGNKMIFDDGEKVRVTYTRK
jgi:hypothetical protein